MLAKRFLSSVSAKGRYPGFRRRRSRGVPNGFIPLFKTVFGYSAPQRMNDPKSLYQSPAGAGTQVLTRSDYRAGPLAAFPKTAWISSWPTSFLLARSSALMNCSYAAASLACSAASASTPAPPASRGRGSSSPCAPSRRASPHEQGWRESSRSDELGSMFVLAAGFRWLTTS